MQLENGKYTIQGLSMLDICNEFGTPLYVYDADVIKKKYEHLKGVFRQKGGFSVKYAMKALSNINILAYIKSLGGQLDTVSIQEAQIGLRAGFSSEEILFTPNGVDFEEIKQAVELGLHINIDNLNILDAFGEYYGSSKPCLIRLNPHVLAGANRHTQVGHADSKFGISIFQIDDILQVVKRHDIEVMGLHMHTGSDILDNGVFLRAAKVLFDAAKYFPNLKVLDFGSGFKVPYKEGDIATDLQSLGTEFTRAFESFCTDYGRNLALWFEPGKFLVSECGYLAVGVNVIKETPSGAFIAVNSGLNHLVRPMMYNAYHHITNISRLKAKTRVYDVVGYICETDTFASNRVLPETQAGDILLIHNAGAYGYSMASNYNSRLRPAEVLVHEAKAHLIRERETIEDLLSGQIFIQGLSPLRSSSSNIFR